VQVFSGLSATPSHLIDTGGVNRADELCYDADDNLVLIANDADSPPFISIISTKNFTIVKKIFMNGTTLPGGNGQGATNGIEQCQYSHTTGLFWLNIPEVGGLGDDSSPGALVAINPKTMNIVNITPVNITLCAGPQGMALGQVSGGIVQLLQGCNAQTTPAGGVPLSGPQNSLVNGVNSAGQVVSQVLLPNQGGSDEVWFEPVSGNFFLANGSAIPAQVLSIASSLPSPSPIQNAFVGFSGSTSRSSHSTAGWNGNVAGVPTSIAFVPVAQLGGTPAPFSSTLCVNSAADAANQGCIGIFGAPNTATQ
jgi:hypothetical protein